MFRDLPKTSVVRVYSRPILEQSSALSFEKKIFSLDMVKNDISLGGASKECTQAHNA